MRSKYGAIRTTYRGVTYASKAEAKYAEGLDLLMKARGKYGVKAWSGQPRFPMVVNGHKICTYIADFLVTYGDGRQEVVDVKGMETSVFRLKKKLYAALYPDGPPLVVAK